MKPLQPNYKNDFRDISEVLKTISKDISDIMKIIAKPYLTLNNTTENEVLNEIQKIVIKESINKIVIGLPLTLSNKESEQTKKVNNFICLLKSKFNFPIIAYDERLTSIAAKRSLITQGIKTGHEKGRVDETAAAIILQEYLDSQS